MTTSFNTIICRYCEIALKGKNRSMFEQRLIDNLKYLLRDLKDIKIVRMRGRICIEHKDKSIFSEDELILIKVQLEKAFGLSSFSAGISCEPTMEAMKDAVKNCSQSTFDKAFIAKKSPSFRVRARRADKRFPIKSRDMEIEIATLIDELYNAEKKLRVDLEDADITVSCEVREKNAFVYFEKHLGPGGLPTGSNGSVLALLSGGIDSPVASSMLMKRGCNVDFLTFHSAPYTPPESVEKVERLVNILNEFQKPGKLYICNLAPIQKEIRDNCQERFRTVLYRRYMFRIAEEIARRSKNLALLTGEAVGQVASQTIVNLSTINNATDMLILRPLAGMDKEEVIKTAKRIDTFDVSIEQVPDSCTVFAPNAPAIAAPLYKIEAEENNLGIEELIAETIEKTWKSPLLLHNE